LIVAFGTFVTLGAVGPFVTLRLVAVPSGPWGSSLRLLPMNLAELDDDEELR
jgi:hypothetical protein